MRCSDARGLIAKRLYEALGAEEAAGLTAHLEQCGACREEAADAAGFAAGFAAGCCPSALSEARLTETPTAKKKARPIA